MSDDHMIFLWQKRFVINFTEKPSDFPLGNLDFFTECSMIPSLIFEQNIVGSNFHGQFIQSEKWLQSFVGSNFQCPFLQSERWLIPTLCLYQFINNLFGAAATAYLFLILLKLLESYFTLLVLFLFLQYHYSAGRSMNYFLGTVLFGDQYFCFFFPLLYLLNCCC